jgi:uncharacterized membrane protein YidH (DUF202 family)
MNNVDTLVQSIKTAIVYPVISLLAVVAVVIFLWGVFEFIKNSTESSKREAGVKHMIWGVVGLAIMFTATGIVNLIIGLWK